MQLAERQHGPCLVPVNFILDEFFNIGQIPESKSETATIRPGALPVCSLSSTSRS